MSWVEDQVVKSLLTWQLISRADDWIYPIVRSEQRLALVANHAAHYAELGWVYPHSQADAFRITGKAGARRIVPVYFRRKVVARVGAKFAARAIPYAGWALMAYDVYSFGQWVHGKYQSAGATAAGMLID